ncbi:MAG: glycosyltransferase family 1 protein, partial [Chloroflexota bacterium]
ALEDQFVLYFNEAPQPGLLPRSDAVRWRVMPSPRFWTVGRLSVEMAIRPPDVLFVPSHTLPPVLPAASVATVHDLGYVHFPDEHPSSNRWLRKSSNRTSANRATRVIAISSTTRDDLMQYEDVSANRITVVHHGCGDEFKPVRDLAQIVETTSHHGLEAPYLIFIGTLQPRKNLERLLQAFDQVAAVRPHVLLALVGAEGWQQDRLARALANVRARDRVRLLGYVDDADLPVLLSGSLGLAFPSLYEGFGLPALEAMACGTPVLASNTSSFPEVVGDAGILVDPTDVRAIARALRRLVDNAEVRRELSAKGLARAANFTWKKAATETLAVLRSAYFASRR